MGSDSDRSARVQIPFAFFHEPSTSGGILCPATVVLTDSGGAPPPLDAACAWAVSASEATAVARATERREFMSPLFDEGYGFPVSGWAPGLRRGAVGSHGKLSDAFTSDMAKGKLVPSYTAYVTE